MEKIKSTPFFKLVFFLIIGIIFSNFSNLKFSVYYFFPIVLLIVSFFLISRKRVLIKSILVSIIFFILGATITSFKIEQRSFIDFHSLKCYTAIVTECKDVTNYQKAKVKLLHTNSYGYLFIPQHLKFNHHDTILFSAVLEPIKQNINIGSFDFYQYCNYNDVYFSNFLKDDIIIKKSDHIDFLEKLKYWLNLRLRKIYENDEVYSVVNALLLGNKIYLEKEVKQVFTDVGGMHVLAVSGLHVGLLVLFFNLILKRLNRIKYGKFLHLLVLTFLLVCFSFLVGNSSSVIRSVFMFLLFTCSTLLQKKNNSINILFFCAFVLLIFNPFYLFDVGFQLSFLAVLGILIFYPLLEQLYLPKNKFVKFLWQLNLISIAAQVFTFPLIVFYFHQFTFLFFISNYITYVLALLLVFGSILILILSLLSLKVSLLISKYFITPIAKSLLSLLMYLTNFDGLILKNIYSDIVVISFLFIISVLFVSLFFNFKKLKLYLLLISISLMIGYNQYLNYSLLKNQSYKLYSYDSSKLSFTIHHNMEALHFYSDSLNFRLFDDFNREKRVVKTKYFNTSDYQNTYLEFDDFVLSFNGGYGQLVKEFNSKKQIYIIEQKLNPKKLAELNKLNQPVNLFLNNNYYLNLLHNNNVKVIKN